MRNYPEDLLSNLEALFTAENKIAEIIRKTGLRFSTNKITGDLGEFYARMALTSIDNLFDSITPNINSNADFDMLGKLSSSSILKQHLDINEIRIEVKTRRAQEGVKYLGGVKPTKFDLLVVVDMSKNYTLNKIYLVKSEVAYHFLDKIRGRLIFKESMAFMSFD